jgi:tetratricopeptide (TPR) repeat protein
VIARDAQAVGGENSAIVQLIMQEARGWARLGDRVAAESAIQRGHDLLQQLPAIHYPRHFIYDRTKFPFYAASCYQWLGDDAKAEEFAEQVFKECRANGTTERSPMRLADIHITLGLVQVRRGNLDVAFDAGSNALAYERKSGPALLIRAAELNTAMAKKFPGTRQAKSFDARLRAIREQFGLQEPRT